MDSVALLVAARTAGLQVCTDGERLIVRGPKQLAALVRQLLSHKDEILPLLELFEERAAVIEYDAGLPRADAERLAWACVLGEPAPGASEPPCISVALAHLSRSEVTDVSRV